MRSFLIATAIGVLATLLLLALAFVADSIGYPSLSRAFFWQNELLQSFTPLVNIGTAAHPIYEGTPLNFLAFIASIPLGFVIYSALAYIVLRSKRGGA